MIKKWVFAGIAYLLVVMIGFGVYDATVKSESDSKQEVNHETKSTETDDNNEENHETDTQHE